MDENTLQTMTSTLDSQPSSSIENTSPTEKPTQPTPVKRAPGRPKGSGKKEIDPNAPPKIKRPVGRPRKDGLPAGSVQRSGRPVGRPRKRPSDGFISAPPPEDHGGPPPMFPFGHHPPPYGGYLPWPPGGPPNPPSVPIPEPHHHSQDLVFPIDPALDQDNWAQISRSDPQTFLRKLLESLPSPNPTSASGSTVEEAFKSHLSSLAPVSKTTPSIPSLYSILKTFWLPSSPSYFSLTALASTRTPSEYRFLYWDPQPLVFNGIACPNCTAPLINRGRIRSGPLKIHDLNGNPFFIIGCEYACTSASCVAVTSSEGRKFASTDASIFRALPQSLKNEFPARLVQGETDLGCGPSVWSWQAAGVSDALWNMVRGCLKAGLRKDVILNIIKGIQDGVPDDARKKPDEDEDDDQRQDGTSGSQEVSMQVTSQGKEGFRIISFQSLAHDYHQAQNADGNSKASGSSSTMNGHSSERSHMQMMVSPELPGYNAGNYVPYPYGSHPYLPPPPPQNPDSPVAGSSSSENMSSKRSYPFAGDGAQESASAAKRVRHCCKCGSSECKGKGGRAFCPNACQDCGKIEECKGRNSKRPEKTCADAWV